MRKCKGCGTGDQRAFDGDNKTHCVSCEEINQDILDEQAREDEGIDDND